MKHNAKKIVSRIVVIKSVPQDKELRTFLMKKGVKVGTEHKVIKPPNNFLESALKIVYIKAGKRKVHLSFYMYRLK